jgi:hypothetical protein
MNILGMFGPTEILIILFIVLLPVIILVDIITGNFKQIDKLIWVIIVILIPFIGSILYLVMGRKNRYKNYN